MLNPITNTFRTLLLLTLPMTAIAQPFHVYGGLEGGFTHVSTGEPLDGQLDAIFEQSLTSKQTLYGPGGRVFLGDQWHKNWGIEAGFALFPVSQRTFYSHFESLPIATISTRFKTQALDLQVVGSTPLWNSPWTLFAKAGVAWMQTKGTLQDLDFITPEGYTPTINKKSIRPTAGLGVAYNWSRVGVFLFWQHYFGKDSSLVLSYPLNQDQFYVQNPSVDMAGIGIRYFIY